MADITDVENALVSLIAGVIYPNGTSQPPAQSVPCKIYAGWPQQSQLDDDLKVGIAHVTIFPRMEERNTTRYTPEWQQVGATAVLQREVRRQERLFQVTIWADTPAHREAVAQPVDSALAAIQFLALADSTASRIRYRGSPIIDNLQKAKLYRRDLLYTVEYATTQQVAGVPVTHTELDITPETYDGATISTVTVTH